MQSDFNAETYLQAMSTRRRQRPEPARTSPRGNIAASQEVARSAEGSTNSPNANTAECSYCLEKIDGMVDPRVLPCGHIHCKGCLEIDKRKAGVLSCPVCREVVDTGIAIGSLCKPESTPKDTYKCEPCQKKGKDVPTAFFCMACSKQMCVRHLEYHDEVHNDHKVISADDYKAKAKKLDIRTCSTHKDQPYIMGCKVCLKVLCQQCIIEQSGCDKARGPHNMTSLDDLEKGAREDISKQRVVLVQMEESMEKLIKEASSIDSKLSEEKDGVVQKIRTAKEHHLKTIAGKYDELERQWCEDRARVRKTLIDYVESTVVTRQKELKKNIIQTDHMLEEHQVDIISRRKDKVDEIQKVINAGYQPLNVTDVKVVAPNGTHSDINLKLSLDAKPSIRIGNGAKAVQKIGNWTKDVQKQQQPPPPRFGGTHSDINIKLSQDAKQSIRIGNGAKAVQQIGNCWTKEVQKQQQAPPPPFGVWFCEECGTESLDVICNDCGNEL